MPVGTCRECSRRLNARKRRVMPPDLCVRCFSQTPVYRADHNARYRPGQRLKKYNLDQATYDAMLAAQAGRCAICVELPSGRGLFIDHDHMTGRVRGLLCSVCNAALGLWRDDPMRLRMAACYLERLAQ